MAMKNGGVSSIYGSNKILHRDGSRKGKTKETIARREKSIKNYKNKSHNNSFKVKEEKIRLTEMLRRRVCELEKDNKRFKKIIMKLVEHTKLDKREI